MPEGPLSRTEMPPFSIMGLLLGGRGYASNYYATRDKLWATDMALQREQQDRAAFAGGLLASEQFKTYKQNPNDIGAQWNLWGQMYGGPAGASDLGNNLLSQGLGHVQRTELANLQHQQQLTETRFAGDEQLRVAEELKRRELMAQQQSYEYLTQVDQEGYTPAQRQMAVNIAADGAGFKRKEGYDAVVQNGAIVGQIPQRGTPERIKMEQTANAYSNIESAAQQMIWERENGQVDKGTWDARNQLIAGDFRRIYEAGAMTEADLDYYNSILPSYGDQMKPEAWGQAREKLRAVQERMRRDLVQYTNATLMPIEQFTADDFKPPANWKPTKPPPEVSPGSARRDLQGQIDAVPRDAIAPEILDAMKPGEAPSPRERLKRATRRKGGGPK